MDSSEEIKKQFDEAIEQRNFEEAEILVQKLLEMDPDNIKYKGRLAKVYTLQNRLDEAETLLSQMEEIDPNNIVTKIQQIRNSKKQGRWGLAEQLSNKVIELDPDNVSARIQLASIYIYQGKLEDAEKLLKEALEIEPDNRLAKNMLITKCKKAEDWENVVKLGTEVLERNPNNLTLVNSLITAYKAQGNNEQVRIMMQKKTMLKASIEEFQEINSEEENTPKTHRQIIQGFRRRIYNGEITRETIEEDRKELAALPFIQQEILAIEAYLNMNAKGQALLHIKQALKQEGISKVEQKLLREAFEMAKSKKTTSSTLVGKRQEKFDKILLVPQPEKPTEEEVEV